jgi:hypothetical protein
MSERGRSLEADRARRAHGIARFFGTAPPENATAVAFSDPAPEPPRYGLQQGYRSGAAPAPVDANDAFRAMIRAGWGEG